jgi:hypothetical protein
MECYSAIKKSEIMSPAKKWMEQEMIRSSAISQPQQDKYHVFTHMWNLDLKHDNMT